MKKILIEGVEATNFGSNNYSCGMEAIVFNSKDITVEEVKALPNVYLHPTVRPCGTDIFAILGTEEQFKEFFKSARDSDCARIALDILGLPKTEEDWKVFSSKVQELKDEFKPWYE